MQSGRRESPREGRARGRWTDTQKKRETDNSQDCWGGIWWTDVCVCELMEESSSLRGPELTFAHKESSLWRAAQTDTEPEASLHSALLNKQRVCVSHKPLGRKLSQGNVIHLPKYHKTPPLSLDPQSDQPNSNIHFPCTKEITLTISMCFYWFMLFLLLQNWPITWPDRRLKLKYIYYLESQKKRWT